MKKFTLLAAALFLFACSDDDGNPVTEQDSYSAHMKTQCPNDGDQHIYDVCVSEPVFQYLKDLREDVENAECLMVEFEDLDGNLVEDYLVRVEMNIVDCPQQ